MDRNVAIEQLNRLIEEGETVLATTCSIDYVLGGPWVEPKVYAPWQAKAAMLLHEILPEHQQKRVKQLEEDDSSLVSTAEGWQAQLQGTLDAIKQGVIELSEDNEETRDSLRQRQGGRRADPGGGHAGASMCPNA